LYRQAVIKADKAHAKTGRRYYVMPNVDTHIMLIVTDRKNFRGLRSKGYIDANFKWEEARNKCFYFTPYKDGTEGITEDELKARQIAYQFWYNARLAAIPEEKKRLREQRRLERKAKRLLNRK